ncbi:MAG: DUF1987 domain-containing protein [Flavobacteriales bacterium]|nr:DUF1987 domain-containing protein [Flavobacteriales bacterium]
MEILNIEPFLQTPEINFNPETGVLYLSGKSYPADAIEFYKPIIDWSKKYIEDPAEKTTLICEIEYLNSASQKQLVELILVFKSLYDDGKDFIVKWKYEEGDDDILSVGELVEHELEIPFQYQEVQF